MARKGSLRAGLEWDGKEFIDVQRMGAEDAGLYCEGVTMRHFQTPEATCKYMASLLPSGVKTILEPTPGEGNLVAALSGYDVTAPVDFWEVYGTWDAIVMNPPFTPMDTGYKILFRCMDMTDTVIALMPWLTLINSERRTKRIIEYGLKSVTHLPRNTFKGSRVQTCVLEMVRGWQQGCNFRAI